MQRCGTTGEPCVPTSGKYPAPAVLPGVMPRGSVVDTSYSVPRGVWGFITDCGAACSAIDPSAETVGYCSGSETNCTDLLGPAVQTAKCSSRRSICRSPPPAFGPSTDPAQSWQRARNCCVYDYGSQGGFPQSVVGNGCGPQMCPGSECCKALATQLCTARGATLGQTDPAKPDPNQDPWAIKGDALCDRLRDWDFDRYRSLMDSVCMGADGKPNAYTRSPQCLAYFNDPKLQSTENVLQRYCRTAPVVPDPAAAPDASGYRRPLDDDLCGCFRPPAYYQQWLAAVNRQWALPDGALDARPGCSYPGCRSALVQDQASVTPADPCKQVNVAVCMQEATVDNGGQVAGDVRISQSCPPGSGLQPRSASGGPRPCQAAADCQLGQVCDPTTHLCYNPADRPTECQNDDPCLRGMVCGPATASGKRFCQAAGAAPAGGLSWGAVLGIVAGSIVGCVLLVLALVHLLR